MSDANLAQRPVEWIYRGRMFLLGHTDLDLELFFQTVHERWARNRLEARRKGITDDAFRADLEMLEDRIDSNRFAFGTTLSMRWLLSPAGIVEYLLLKIQKGQTQGGEPIMRQDLVTLQRDDPDAWNALVDQVLRNDFPNLTAPALATETTGAPEAEESSSAATAGP